MEGNFIRVYRSTPDRRRVLFVWLYNSRLKNEPLSLSAFCVYNPSTNEYASYVFTESCRYDLRRELSSFLNHVCSYEEFLRISKLSQDQFCALLKDINISVYDNVDIERLF